MKNDLQRVLLEIAHDAIARVFASDQLAAFDVFKELAEKYPILGRDPALREKRATFVTLTIGGRLRGCIGMLEARRSLAVDVAENAVAAAFGDPRFPPLSPEEFKKIEIHLSILSAPEELFFSSEGALLSRIRPGVDGLILQEGDRRGTFLPSVWEELPEKESFLRHLKLKAGLPSEYWSDTLRVFRYTAEYIQ